MRPRGHIQSPTSDWRHHNQYQSRTYPPVRHGPHPPTGGDSPLREHDLPAEKDAEPTTTVQHMPKTLPTHHVPDKHQLPREGKHTRRITPTCTLPTGTINWKEIVPGVVTVGAIHLITTKQIKLSPAEHLFTPIQGTATIGGATLGDDDQKPQARPTQAIWVTAATDADIAINPGFEWSAIHYTVESTVGDPKTTNWQQRWGTEVEQLSDAALNDTLTPQTMVPAKRATQTCLSTAKHTIWHYPTTIHPEAVSQIEETLSLEPPDTHNARKPGGFTAYWSFPTAAGMVAKVAEPTLPPSVTAPTKAVQAMARREGAPLEWTPNTLLEQRVHHNANKTQQTGRQIHPWLWDKDGNLQPHSPWMVHFVLEDHSANRKSTELQLTHNLLGGSICMVKKDGKGGKMTGFKRQKKIVVLMAISKPSQTSMAK